MVNLETIINDDRYDFLKESPHLGRNVFLLGLGGSHAYGTNNENSDVDVRGCALNSKNEILLRHDFEQVVDTTTDTTIYSFNKLINLLVNCNPNVIEILGLKPEHYLFINKIGEELLKNKSMFLSKKATHSFGGYANAQLRRLDNKSARLAGMEEREKHVLNSINNASYTFREKYATYTDDQLKLYVGQSEHEDMEYEIFMDITLKHYPLRDWKGLYSEMSNIIRDYSKIGKRNKNAIEHNKLGKHMCHLVRLYYMAFDILEKKEIITYRKAEHDFLMDIRNGKFLDDNRQPVPEFFEIVSDLEKRLAYDVENTDLPEYPDYDSINCFVAEVNERIVKGEYE